MDQKLNQKVKSEMEAVIGPHDHPISCRVFIQTLERNNIPPQQVLFLLMRIQKKIRRDRSRQI
jgi:hypothetical protein